MELVTTRSQLLDNTRAFHAQIQGWDGLPERAKETVRRTLPYVRAFIVVQELDGTYSVSFSKYAGYNFRDLLEYDENYKTTSGSKTEQRIKHFPHDHMLGLGKNRLDHKAAEAVFNLFDIVYDAESEVRAPSVRSYIRLFVPQATADDPPVGHDILVAAIKASAMNEAQVFAAVNEPFR